MRVGNNSNLPLFPSRTFSVLAEVYFSDLSVKQAHLAREIYERHLHPLKERTIADIASDDVKKICADMAARNVRPPEILKTVNLLKDILGRAVGQDGLQEDVLMMEYATGGAMSGPTHVVTPDVRGVVAVLRDISATTKKMLEALESMAAGQPVAPGSPVAVPAGLISLEEVYRRSGWHCG